MANFDHDNVSPLKRRASLAIKYPAQNSGKSKSGSLQHDIICQQQQATTRYYSGEKVYQQSCDGGIVVSIAAFQAVDPGSIPGHRK